MSTFPPGAVRREATALLSLAGPIVAVQLTNVGLNFTDTVMAGRLGAEALASVAAGGALWSAITMAAKGVLMALPPSVAQLIGAERRSEIGPLVGQALWVAAMLAAVNVTLLLTPGPVLRFVGVDSTLIPTIVGYLGALAWAAPARCGFLVLRFLAEGLSNSRPAMLIGTIGLAVNVVANYALMFGHFGFPALGAVGCGYATAAVWWAQLAAMAAYLRLGSHGKELRGLVDWPRIRQISSLLRLGLPIGMTIFVEVSLFATIALLMGSIGAIAAAGHQVAINFAALTFMVPLGLSLGITVRVGLAQGRGDAIGVKVASSVGVGMALCAQIVSATVMAVFGRQIARIYTTDLEVVEIAAALLLLAAVFQLSDGLQASAAGALRGLKDTRMPMLITVVSYWLVGLPLGHWLGFSRGLGPRGLWTGLIVGLTIAAGLLATRLVRQVRAAGTNGHTGALR